ncbi:MAG: alpha-2-macroglobulin family protein [Bacteroidetes bacterium]|nr:alpha-2-macroglobulin family protein [Bacteroidota bacterium]
MKRTRFLLSLLGLFLFSCLSRNEVRISNRNFGDEIEQQQNLIFTFDKDLVPDSLLNTWDTIPYMIFSPAVKGKFKWNTTRELVFSPSVGFKASTDYKAELAQPLLRFTRMKFRLDPGYGVAFHTPYLKLQEVKGYWAVSEKNPGAAALKLALGFNYPVDPGTAAKLMQLSVGTKTVAYEISTTGVSSTLTLVVDGFNRDSLQAVPITVAIEKGLKCTESEYLTKEKMELIATIPSPEKLEITQALGEYEGSSGMIHVYTSQSIDGEKAEQFIQVNPKIAFTVELTENGFFLKGNFTSGSSYQLDISDQLKGTLGGSMEKKFSSQVAFGEMAPTLAFVNTKGIYLSTKSSRNVAVRISSIPKVEVKVWRVYENNIMHYLRQGRNTDYWYDDEGEYNSNGDFTYNTYDLDYFGSQIYQRTYETKDLARQNGVQLLNLNFEELGSFKGIYLVQVASSERQWQNTTKLVSISDIGMIVKQSDDDILVFANSIKTTEPLSGASISLITSNNQTLMTATTNGDGVATFSKIKSRGVDFRVSMVTAKHESDFNYITFSDSRVNNSRFDVGGRRADETGMMAFLYGDRTIYRPGETIHLNTIVRTEQWQNVSGVPVKVTLLMPNGREFKTIRGTLNKQGALESSFELPQAALTGNYVAEVFSSNDVLLTSEYISVEEFLPDRIDVKLNLSKEELKPGDSLRVNLAALNLFGPPAAGRKYEMQFTVQRKQFSSKDFQGYVFDIHTDNKVALASNDVREGMTDTKGLASESFRANAEWEDEGLISTKVFATVFDETGRPVNRVKNFNIYTQEVFFGMKLTDYYITRGESLRVPMIATDKKGKGIATSASISVVKYDWYSVIEKDEYGGRYRYISKKREILQTQRTVDFAANGYDFVYTPRESGEYEIRISRPGSERYVATHFYSFGWGYTSNTSFQVNSEGQVDIQADKEKYKVGDKAHILFKAPFNGRLLVTIECDKVIEYRYLNTDKKAAVLDLHVKEGYMPNVYITATLFRSLDDGSIPLTVGHGFLPLIVEKDGSHLPVTILAEEKSRSKTKQTIKVKTLPKQDIEVTLAVVDEGILSLKNYETPDPHAFFYQKKALLVNAYDVYPNLLPDLKLNRSSSGGDGSKEFDMSKRVNPLNNKRVKLIALWSGILHTNAAGEADYTIDIPQFSGDLRIMACVYKDKSFGSAEKHMKVADPIVISPSMPRFLSPKDTLRMPVTITNTTGKTTSALAKIHVGGPLKIVGEDQKQVSIEANSEQRVIFRIVAEAAMGEANVKVDVNAFNETFSDKTDITVRPVTSLIKISGSGELTGTQNIELKNGFIPATAAAKLVISQNPLVQFSKPLSYLIGYPYGCIEQTTSKAFPQIYYADLVKNMKFGSMNGQSPSYYVQQAIRKLEGMQLYNGSLSYWPGGDDETWWGTNYAIHFLCEAKKAGYEVNGQIIQRALTYMAQKVKTRLMEEEYGYYDDRGGFRIRKIYAKENIYSLYLLALYGKADVSSMNFFKANAKDLALDCRYMLACTYLAIGDRKNYSILIPGAFQGEQSKNAFSGSFYSYLRDEALVLNVMLDTDPENPQIPILIRHLSQQVNKQEYLNTQEAAYSFLALGKFSRKVSATQMSADVSINGKSIGKFSGSELVLKKGIAGQNVSVTVNGTGHLYYFWEQEGLSASGNVKEEDKFLQIRKSFLTRFGQPVSNLKNIKQGDLIVVKLSLSNLERTSVDNVVITDMLPAGFEIENPRLNDSRDMSWMKDQSDPDYFDVRDDRIHFFTSVKERTKNFYYLVRAVTPGNFQMGPASADAMYNGEYHSYSGSGTVNIQ